MPVPPVIVEYAAEDVVRTVVAGVTTVMPTSAEVDEVRPAVPGKLIR